MNISWISRNGEITLFTIFDDQYRGKGFGHDALLALMDFAFNVIDMNSVYLWVVAFNEHAYEFYKRIGFKDQGRIRELAFRDNQQHDVVTMDFLKSEFNEMYGTLPK